MAQKLLGSLLKNSAPDLLFSDLYLSSVFLLISATGDEEENGAEVEFRSSRSRGVRLLKEGAKEIRSQGERFGSIVSRKVFLNVIRAPAHAVSRFQKRKCAVSTRFDPSVAYSSHPWAHRRHDFMTMRHVEVRARQVVAFLDGKKRNARVTYRHRSLVSAG